MAHVKVGLDFTGTFIIFTATLKDDIHAMFKSV